MLDTKAERPRALARSSRAEYRGALAQAIARDWRFLAGVIVTVLLLTALPYLYGYASSPAGLRFGGLLVVEDHLQYFSWLRDHRSAWLVANRMTPEPNQPALFNLLWFSVAQLQAATGWPVAMLFQLLRLAAGTALLVMIYLISKLFTASRSEHWIAYLIIVFGAGLGWIWVVEKYLRGLHDVRFPLDIYVAEANTFQIIMVFPHFTVATTLITAVFGLYLLGVRRASWGYAALGAVLALILTLQHAYDLLIVGLVPAGMLGLILLRDRRIPWRAGLMLGLIGGIAVPPAAYFTWLTTQNALWRQVLAQFDNAGVFTPPPQHLLILMGIPLLLVIAALIWSAGRLIWRLASGQVRLRQLAALSPDNLDLFLWSWLVVGFLLLYIPSDFQIHMFNAWQVPLGLLAARILCRRVVPALRARSPRAALLAPALLVLAVLPTNLYLSAWRTLDMARHQPPHYLTADEDAALSWLDQHTTHEDVVLSGLKLGQFVPARSDARAFLAHWAQTVDFYSKQRAVREFFATSNDTAQSKLLQQYAVTYVLYTSEERSLGGFNPAQSPRFEQVFNKGKVAIYRVRR